MTGGLWSPERHKLAGHPGEAEGCEACTEARLECQSRLQFKTAWEVYGLLRELHDRRKVAPPLKIRDCVWCGYWHMLPLRFVPAIPVDAEPSRRRLRPGWVLRALRGR